MIEHALRERLFCRRLSCAFAQAVSIPQLRTEKSPPPAIAAVSGTGFNAVSSIRLRFMKRQSCRNNPTDYVKHLTLQIIRA
jgi:hypothetical protein